LIFISHAPTFEAGTKNGSPSFGRYLAEIAGLHELQFASATDIFMLAMGND
jgi:hypothetical protein